MIFKFWKRRGVPDIKRGNLDPLESKLIQTCAERLPGEYGFKITQQLKHLPKQRRYDVDNIKIVELYPESMNSIPRDLLFERTQEFKICMIKFVLNEANFTAKLKMGMGAIFEITIRPIPKIRGKEFPGISVKDVTIEENLSSNILYKRHR